MMNDIEKYNNLSDLFRYKRFTQLGIITTAMLFVFGVFITPNAVGIFYYLVLGMAFFGIPLTIYNYGKYLGLKSTQHNSESESRK